MRAVLLRIILIAAVLWLLPGGAEADAARAYRLGASDALRVTVFDEPDLSGTFSVDGGGRLALPLIGEVRVGGLTLEEAEARIVARLADGYLKHPRVALEVANYRPFYILGEVRNPGQYPYAEGMTVMKAVALAGGFTYRADEDDVEITAAGAPQARDVPPDTAVMPGDTIRIGERFF
ncbi:polysaccharide biosynthesis/export family protein [Caenispirillum salinarum]|uniref:polysaccharide biosynthesis/export family protein n=1 Tax=Caenispirillum salinarum TaxID=859058 RepID=UPI00384A84B0